MGNLHRNANCKKCKTGAIKEAMEARKTKEVETKGRYKKEEHDYCCKQCILLLKSKIESLQNKNSNDM